MVNKTKCFPKLIPTSWHKPVYLSEIQIKYFCLHYIGSLARVSSKKGINKICKGNVFFYKYVHISRLQMKKKVFFPYIKTNNV